VLIVDFSGSARCLGDDALRILTKPNAGGNSILSEALACEVMVKAFGGTDVRGELEIRYSRRYVYPCDLMLRVKNINVGVSVTRAMHWLDPRAFCADTAYSLVERKSQSVLYAQSVGEGEDSHDRSVLFVWCQTPRIADRVVDAYHDLLWTEKPFLICAVVDRTQELFLRRLNYLARV